MGNKNPVNFEISKLKTSAHQKTSLRKRIGKPQPGRKYSKCISHKQIVSRI